MPLIMIIVIVLVCLTMGYICLTLWVGLKWAGLQKRLTLACRGVFHLCTFDASLLPDVCWPARSGAFLIWYNPTTHRQWRNPSSVELWPPRTRPNSKGRPVAAHFDGTSLSFQPLRQSLLLICKAVTLTCDKVKAWDDRRGARWFAAVLRKYNLYVSKSILCMN